jgi:hypothetical protein
MRRTLASAFILALLALPFLAAPAVAFPLSTCDLEIVSLDASGEPIDAAGGGANDSTQADPFEVDWDGSVAYIGTTNVVIKDYSYQISVFGIPTPLQGNGTNEDENTDGDGEVSVGANSPFRAAGLYFVSGTYSGEGGTCTGSGWFFLNGDPVGTLPWIIGLILVILGSLGLVGGLRGMVLLAVLGGLFLGVGLDLLLISYGFLPFGEITPLAVVSATIVLGILSALMGRRGGSEPLGV